VDCWVIHHPPLDFHGAGGRGRRPWLCKHAPSSRTGADGPQAEERAIAADAHRIARVRVTNFCFLFFSKKRDLNFSVPLNSRPPNTNSRTPILILSNGSHRVIVVTKILRNNMRMVQTDRAKGRHALFRGIRIVKTSRLIFDCLKRIQVSYVSTEELVCTMGKRK
jgi:hypothetical protein